MHGIVCTKFVSTNLEIWT